MKTDTTLPHPELRQLYPESDGRESGEHSGTFDWVLKLLVNLQNMYCGNPEVFVAARLLWYPCDGRPDIRHAPHAMIAFGRPQGDRTAYLQWIEGGVAPQVAFEIRPRLETEGQEPSVFEFYERYGVEEYLPLRLDVRRAAGLASLRRRNIGSNPRNERLDKSAASASV